jgi:hypothetical protein
MANRLLHSKRRKKKAFATQSLIKIIFRPTPCCCSNKNAIGVLKKAADLFTKAKSKANF